MNADQAARGARLAGLSALKILSRVAPLGMGELALKRAFARKMVEMRGVPMKMAQALSMSAEAEVSELHRIALSEIPALSGKALWERLHAAGNPLLDGIIILSEQGLAASLGQVHRAQMRDGRICALKVKHEGIDPAMDMDTGLMEFLVSVFGHFREGFASEAFRALLAEELRGELDYPYEARRQETLHAAFAGTAGIVIPRPYPGESGSDYLLMDWEDSLPILEFARTATDSEKREAARLLADFHLRSLFHCGLVHADPNPGNFGLRRGGSGIELVVYDFGSVLPMASSLVEGFVGLLASTGSGGNPMPILASMGFSSAPLTPIAEKLPALCEILLEPFLAGDAYRLEDWDRKRRVMDLLGAERWNFMLAAPPPMFFLMRALKGLFHYLGLLGGQAPIASALKSALRDGPGRNTARIAEVEAIPGNQPEAGRTKLRLEVSEDRNIRVSLTLPGSAAGRLQTLLEPELEARIAARGIDVAALSLAAEAAGFAPMRLFDFHDSGKSIRIWLE